MEVKERKKVEACKTIEAKVQARWEEARIFETNAPQPGTDEWKKPKESGSKNELLFRSLFSGNFVEFFLENGDR